MQSVEVTALTNAQTVALACLCERHGVPFDPARFTPTSPTLGPPGTVFGVVGEQFVYCAADGTISP